MSLVRFRATGFFFGFPPFNSIFQGTNTRFYSPAVYDIFEVGASRIESTNDFKSYGNTYTGTGQANYGGAYSRTAPGIGENESFVLESGGNGQNWIFHSTALILTFPCHVIND